MAKVSKRIENSYEAYLNYRESWSDKGYGLDRKLKLEEYAEAHEAISSSGEQHIARKIAQDDRTFTRSEGAAVVRRLKNAGDYEDVDLEALEELQSKYKKGKDIYGRQLSGEEEQEIEERRRNRYLERGIVPEHTIQATARAQLFNELRDAGLSYKEAEEVLYG